ncbi:L-threonylcarbamoyladenylate synthase [Rapidithrix thailandica]|uniref:L-threonylcarbamoyladenylate synthase n=1 Tax=Rapidithrix thailandica TaxID=413964 RepID=A0AAW9RSU4_9BACT
MMAELLKINPDNPQIAKIRKVAEVLQSGGLVIYPTDTVYGLGCNLFHQKAIQRLCHLRGLKPNKLNLSFICHDLSNISTYAKVSDPAFKLMKKALPGPFTFILPSSNKVPKILEAKKKQVGIRVPENLIPREIVKELGNPVISASIKDEDEILEYSTDPELIFEKYQKHVDIVIDGGFGGNIGSTIIDCFTDEFEITREGKGDINQFL